MSTPASPIPRPGGSGFEYVPKPGIPENYPWYLKPIRVNTRSIKAEFQRYLGKNNKRLARILYSSISANPGDIKYQEIRNAMMTGELDAKWLRRWQQKHYRMIVKTLQPEWEAAWSRSSELMSQSITSAIGEKFTTTAASSYARKWMTEHAAEHAVRFSATQEKAVRAILTHFTTTEPVSVAEMGRLLRSSIGLTPKQVTAMKNARLGWVNEGLSSDVVEKKVGDYFGFLHRERALRIASTEIQYAYNNGQLNGMKEARDAGLFGDRIPIKIWETNAGACDFCSGLEGQIILLDETYPHSLNGTSYCPPAHPYCTCGIRYELWHPGDFVNIAGRAPVAMM